MARGDSIDDTRETPATDTVEAVPLGKRVRQLATQLGPARLIATVVFLCLAVVVARFGWELPLTNAAEDQKSTLLNSSHYYSSRIPSSACKKKKNITYKAINTN